MIPLGKECVCWAELLAPSTCVAVPSDKEVAQFQSELQAALGCDQEMEGAVVLRA